VQFAERACQLTNYGDARFLDVLGAAYARAGRFDDAVTTAENAVQLARAASQDELARDIESRLVVYRDGHGVEAADKSPSNP